MTSKNLNWKNRKTVYKPRPFLLQPACKEALWGGQKLKEHFGKQADLDNIAESWECSTHPEGPSTVVTGEHKGMLLTEVLRKHPEYLGTHPRSKGELPILVKFIDARQKLSVQVHPDDEYAKLYERGQLGKTEMWYVLEADKDAELIYGFYSDMDSVAVRQSLANGTIEKYLQKVKVQQDDVFYIPAGTVHGIGAGNLIAEVQESSNLTYRLYDYDRIDKQRQKRKLHIEKALAVANLKGQQPPRQPLRVLRYTPGCATEFLCRCKYFQVERLLLNTDGKKKFAELYTGSNSFQALLCLDGGGHILMEDKEKLAYSKGNCIFIPANTGKLQLCGRSQFLKISC
ncbi:type I phosphomannose isomerase catalytic subunit [Phascolarctobacterium faecium]|uniref:type I phosphomannose isomerase catalytic subunit n=3 Tax=Phascolarctobacterium faecium TaxID=33025 RepID=UPI0010329829|nr:type I phosphomannose isomerase catalytic subunit [Phascolarctobacterium faecium]